MGECQIVFGFSQKSEMGRNLGRSWRESSLHKAFLFVVKEFAYFLMYRFLLEAKKNNNEKMVKRVYLPSGSANRHKPQRITKSFSLIYLRIQTFSKVLIKFSISHLKRTLNLQKVYMKVI